MFLSEIFNKKAVYYHLILVIIIGGNLCMEVTSREMKNSACTLSVLTLTLLKGYLAISK